MKFKKWLDIQEVGTGTNAIAVFAQRLAMPSKKKDSEKCEEPPKNKG